MPIKYDTGAKYTVISARALNHNLKDEGLQRIKEYCETNISCKEQFGSASGDPFWGYLVHAENVRKGESSNSRDNSPRASNPLEGFHY